MQTNSEPEGEPNANWAPPRGIRYLPEREGRENGFGLSWREGGKPQFRFFPTAQKREVAAQKLAEAKEEHGRAAMAFDPVEYAEAKLIVGGFDLRKVARAWIAFRGGNSGSDSLLARDAARKYLALRFSNDVKAGSDTARHIDLHVRRFVAQFGDMKLCDVTPVMLREWLPSIVSNKTGQKIGLLAQRQHRKDLNVFYCRAVREGWTDTNPLELVDAPVIPAKDVQILTVDQAKRLLFANRGFPIAARLALEMFGGLRAASVERLKKEHVDFESHGIRLPADLHKSGRTMYRQGQPDVLWKWLKAAPEETWTKINEGNYGHEKVKAVRRAFGPDFTLPHNVLRHSFASYHIAGYKSLSQTGYLMQHTSGHTTSVYEGVARESDAKKYFSISPK